MNYYNSKKESTTPGNGNSAGAVDHNRYLDRIDFTNKDLLKNPEQSVMIGVTKDGKKNEGLSPTFSTLDLKENLLLSYVMAMKSGEMVSGIIWKRFKKTGAECLCLQLTDDPEQELTRQEFIHAVIKMLP